MSFFINGLRAKVMSTELIIEANVSKKTLLQALSLVREFEAKYSAYKEDSLLSKINQHSGESAVECSKEELEIFEKALEIAKLSNGLFDPTIGSLTQGLYGFGTTHQKVPNSKELEKVQKLVDYKKVTIDKNSIFLKEKGMRFDLGGIGKGFIADKLFSFLQTRGATKALISVGGEIVTFGKHYKVAIKDPFADGNIAVIHTNKQLCSVSTSGDYERYIDSKEHHHILDNKSAKQNHYYSSITLIKSGLEATMLDGVATIAFNTPLKELQTVADKYSIAIIAVTPNKEIVVKNFSDLNIKNLEIFQFKAKDQQ